MTIYVVGDGRSGTVTLEYLSRNISGNVIVCCNNPDIQFEIAKSLDHIGYTEKSGDRMAAFCPSIDTALQFVKTGNYQNVVLTGSGRTRTMKKLEKLKNAGVQK